MQSQISVTASITSSVPCSENNRLLDAWTRALNRSCALRRELCRTARPSLEELRKLQVQLDHARTQLRNCWSLLDQHRIQHGCAQSGKAPLGNSLSSAAQLYPPPTSAVRSENSLPKYVLNRAELRESAGHRRDHELQQLAREGMPVVFHGRWHVSIGLLHVWPHAGRWSNEDTRTRGKIGSLTMRALIRRELTGNEDAALGANLQEELSHLK